MRLARAAMGVVVFAARTFVSDASGGRGATIDYDPRAHEDAEKQVRAFLAAHLGK